MINQDKKKCSNKIISILLSCFVVLLVNQVPQRADSRTFVVSKDGSGDFSKINKAIRMASDGDKIIVRKGVYHEKLKIEDRRNLTISGDEKNGVVVKCKGKGPVINIRGASVNIYGMRVECMAGWIWDLIKPRKYGYIAKVFMRKNRSAIFIDGVGNVTINNVYIQVKGPYRYGIRIRRAQYVVIKNCVIERNFELYDKYDLVWRLLTHDIDSIHSRVRISRNAFLSKGTYGIDIFGGRAEIAKNNIKNKHRGISIYRTNVKLLGNTIAKNNTGLICSNPHISKLKSSMNRITENSANIIIGTRKFKNLEEVAKSFPKFIEVEKIKVSNVFYFVRGNQIVITYNLAGNTCSDIKVTISTDAGKTFKISPKSVTGDVGKCILPGNEKVIIWNILNDMERGLKTENAVIRVTAN